MSSYLLSSKKTRKITQLFLCFQEMQLTGFSRISSLHSTYCQRLMKKLAFLMWPVKQEPIMLYPSIETGNLRYLQMEIETPLENS